MSLPVFQSARQSSGPFGHTPGQWLVSAAMLFFIAVGTGVVLGRMWTDPTYSLDPAVAANAKEAEEVASIRAKTEHQIAALTAKVASLQAQVNRLNMVGERLIDAARLPGEQINLRDDPPVGGPAQQKAEDVTSNVNSMLEELSLLEQQLSFQQNRFSMLESLDLHHNIGFNSVLSGGPTHGGYISSEFGARTDPFTGEAAIHQGVDIAGPEGSAIYATAGGIVTWSGERTGYGKMVEIEHVGGYRTRYAHAKSVKVRLGQMVTKGQQIAVLGSTGRSTGPHVHFEVLKNGVHLNPVVFMDGRDKNFDGFARTVTQSQR